MNPLTQSKNATILPILIALMFGCFGLLPQARAVCQQGCLTSANTFLGDNALFNLTTGTDNTAVGFFALFYNTTGDFNTANGSQAMDRNTTGRNNTASGALALFDNTTGGDNTATGAFALLSNTTGSDNTASGFFALLRNTTGSENTATGEEALLNNTIGTQNTATGHDALFENTTGGDNTATGTFALLRNRTGNNNTASGVNALFNNHTGSDNTAIGDSALLNNKHGSKNIALGSNAGINLIAGNNNIYIANRGVAGESNAIHIGIEGTHTDAFVAGISGTTVAGGVGVIIDTSGHLGTVVSSERFKANIQPMDKASEVILELQPVTFHYKKDLDPEGIPQFGLVAEDVAKVNPDLVVRDPDGKPYSVRYDQVNAMLLNEFLKEHREVQELKKQLAALTVGLQKVSAQLEARKLAPHTVMTNQ